MTLVRRAAHGGLHSVCKYGITLVLTRDTGALEDSAVSPHSQRNPMNRFKKKQKKNKKLIKTCFFRISFFLIFPFWTQRLLIFDRKIGFLVQNCIFWLPDMSRIPESGQKWLNIFFRLVYFINHIMGWKNALEVVTIIVSGLILVFALSERGVLGLIGRLRRASGLTPAKFVKAWPREAQKGEPTCFFERRTQRSVNWRWWKFEHTPPPQGNKKKHRGSTY